MASTDETWEPPFLSWKGMQLWSVGYRASAICEMFMGLKTKKLSSLKKGKRRKWKGGENGVLHPSEEDAVTAEISESARCSSLQLPAGRLSCALPLDEVPRRHSVSIECSGRSGSQLKRYSDATAGNRKPSVDGLKRNSDASLCRLPRLSFSPSSSSPGGAYERVWVLERADHLLPTEMKLGGRRSDASVQLGRQYPSASVNQRSSCSSFSSSSPVASAASAIAKITGRWSGAGCHESEQRHVLSQLLTGNQFLTHVTAAPAAVPRATEHVRPSEGLLLDASVRCREAELKDRIIFFL